jgi:hypothetical protein
MQPISYARHQFSAEIIRHAVWLYLRFTLSYRDVEELLAERGIDVSYETVRRWVVKFGPAFARNLRRRRPKPTATWHLDEMVISIQGRRMLRARCWICWSSPSGTGLSRWAFLLVKSADTALGRSCTFNGLARSFRPVRGL